MIFVLSKLDRFKMIVNQMFNFLVPGCPLQIYSKQRRERSDK